MPRLAVALAAAALLAACEARFGNDAAPVDEKATAAGPAGAGRVTIEAPGFNMSIDLPESVEAELGEQDGLIYPGATIGGLHVQGGRDPGGRDGGAQVELRFTTADGADRIAAWYRDPARGEQINVQSSSRAGTGIVLSGTAGRDQEPFTLRLAPADEGGTEGRLLLTDRN